MELFQDTNTWVFISFVIFAVVAYKLGRSSVLATLDQKIERIKYEIDTAENLRVEAQELLAQYRRKQREADTEATKIINTASEHAKLIQKKAEAQLDESVERREKWLAQRLKRMEEDAIAEMKEKATELAIEATKEILLQKLDKDTHSKFVEQTISKLPEKIKSAA